MKRYWFCEIGSVDAGKIPFGGDFPMRQAVKEAYFKLTGQYAEVLSSGWQDDDVERGNAKDLKCPQPEGDVKYQLDVKRRNDVTARWVRQTESHDTAQSAKDSAWDVGKLYPKFQARVVKITTREEIFE